MSVCVRIKQKSLFKKKINIKDIIDITSLDYGYCDEHYCLKENEFGEHTLLYDKKKLARGIDVGIEGNDVTLLLNLPTSKEEIRTFYDIIEKICHYLKVENYIREEEIVSLGDNKKFIKYDEEGSINGLKDLKEKIDTNEYSGFQMFGVYNPISLGKKEMKIIDNDLDNLSNLLHKLQSLDVYYACAHVYEVDNKLVGIYAIGANIPSVVPLKPYIVLNQIEGIQEWFVILDHGKMIKYDDFIKNVGKTKYYDDNHVIVNIDENKVKDLIKKYGVEM